MGLLDFLNPLKLMAQPMGIFGLDDILIGGTIGKGVLDFFGGRSANDAEKDARKQYNDYLAQRSQVGQDILGGLQSSGWNPYGPNTLGSTSYGTTSGTTSTNQLQQQRAVTAPEQRAMEDATRALIMGRLGQPSAVSEGEKLRALSAIRSQAQPALTAEQNVAARFGGTNPGAAAASPAARGVAAQSADFLASLPEVARQRRAQDIGLSEQFQTARRGQNIRTTGTTTSQGTTQGGGTQQVGPDIGALQSLLMPVAPQASMNTGYNPYASAGGDLLGGLMKLYAGRPNQSGAGAAGPMPTPWGYG